MSQPSPAMLPAPTEAERLHRAEIRRQKEASFDRALEGVRAARRAAQPDPVAPSALGPLREPAAPQRGMMYCYVRLEPPGSCWAASMYEAWARLGSTEVQRVR